MKNLDSLIRDLPDAESARRFLDQFGEKNPSQTGKLLKNEGLLSDVLTLVSFSPLLATTVLQNPNYLWWLNRHRTDSKIRDKEELLESLARFALTNSTIEPQILLARFRRRELLRIFLHDIRRLATVSEITEEISNLADAILEYALSLAKQELDNRYGTPLETDQKGRAKSAEFCVVSLGKLGSKELNYSSDIDLLFVYSADGKTSGQGTKGEVTNREYFVKLAEFVAKLVGQQTGEGAAYRVDLRLRPHGRIGALALSVKDTIRYYRTEARNWERQVLIRSRASAGDTELYKNFFDATEDFIFSKGETVENALRNVRLSKEKINLEKSSAKGFDVKLGMGGIREIEFMAQALQLAYGGLDEWLRVSHTLKSLSRLADRNLFSENELTVLFDAYEFLRRLEHLLQMENGLQTHLVPDDEERRLQVARRMNFGNLQDFNAVLSYHSANVNRIFTRIFSTPKRKAKKSEPIELTDNFSFDELQITDYNSPAEDQKPKNLNQIYQPILSSLEKSDLKIDLSTKTIKMLEKLSIISPPFAEIVAANPVLIRSLPNVEDDFTEKNYAEILLSKVKKENDFARRLAILRQNWSQFLLEIVVFDVFEKLSRKEARKQQTRLAEASLETAIFITKSELEKRFSVDINDFGFAVLGLGKLGGKGMDYGSDLDLILIYDDGKAEEEKGRRGEEEKGRRGEEEKGRRGEEEKGRRGEEEKGRRGEEEKGRRGEEEKGRRGEEEKGRRGEEEMGRRGEEEKGRRGEEEMGRRGEEEMGRRGEEEKGRRGEEEEKVTPNVSSSPLLPISSSLFYARAVEIFVTTLSAMTREGSLYRVDLRLRPDGKNGATSISKTAFLDYLQNRSAIWEWLAYVKLRIVSGDLGLGEYVETEARRIIHQKALSAETGELKSETRRIRERLEEQKSNSRKTKEIDIKFGAGGMLDVYFAMRFLQLRDNVPDESETRSTDFMLEKLYANKSLGDEDFANFSNGYLFLSELDHNLRLTVGRSTRLPIANQNALQIICERMKLASINELLETLTLHRLNIRASFENILK